MRSLLILILSLISIVLVTGPAANAVMWDLGNIVSGKQMIPAGAPWAGSDQPQFYGTSKQASIFYNSTSGNLDIVGSEVIITAPIGTSDIDRAIFIADEPLQVTKIEEVHSVAQNTAYPNTGSITVKRCTGSQAPGSGTALHSVLFLNSTINVIRATTLTSNTTALNLSDGDRLCIDANGTMTTFAGGSLTIHMRRL